MRMKRIAPLAALGLIACVSLFPESGAPPQIYRLSDPEPTGEASQPRPWTIEVSPAEASRALATNRVAVSPDGVEIAYAAGARWSAATPRLMQDLMIAALGADGRVLAAVRPEDGVRASCELRMELTNFEAVYDEGETSPPSAVVRTRVMLVDPGTRRLVAASVIGSRVRADDVRMRAIISAFDAAAQESARDIVAWTLEQGARPVDGGEPACADRRRPLLRGGDRGAGAGEDSRAADEGDAARL